MVCGALPAFQLLEMWNAEGMCVTAEVDSAA